MTTISNKDYWAMMQPWAIKVSAFKDTGDEFSFKAIFDRNHQEYGDDLRLSGNNARLICRSVDISNLEQDNPITVEFKEYDIDDVQHDGWGLTTITLINTK